MALSSAPAPVPVLTSSAPIAQSERLVSSWTMYFTEKITRDQKFQDKLQKICTFSTPEELAFIYARLEKPSKMAPNVSVYFVKSATKLPVWEEHIQGGTYQFNTKKTAQADRVWERLIFAALGETIQEPAVSAIQVSIKHESVQFTVWNFEDMTKKVFSRLQLKLGDVLETPVVAIAYITNFDSIKDKADKQKADAETGQVKGSKGGQRVYKHDKQTDQPQRDQPPDSKK